MAARGPEMSTSEAQAMLEDLASVFLRGAINGAGNGEGTKSRALPDPQAGYRSLVDPSCTAS